MGYYAFPSHTVNGILQNGAQIQVLSDDTYRAAYDRFLVRLKQARGDAGLTQAEVARVLGKPQSFMSKVESGERRLDFVELQVLAQVYRKPLSFFEHKSGV